HAQPGSDTNFVIGLGITAVSDAIFSSAKAVGFTIDAIALGFFFLMGRLAQRGTLWPFFLGAAVYLLDALIYVMVKEWMPVAFHALALFFILNGAMSLRAALRSAGVRWHAAALDPFSQSYRPAPRIVESCGPSR